MADYKAKALSLKMQYPKDYISFSRGFTSSHRGVDMAWNSKYGGANAPIYAPADGIVVAMVNTKGNTWKQGKGDWGNYVKIKHADGIYTLSAHMLKGSIVVKVGQAVKRGDYLGKQNNSGYSNGSHDHFEVYVGGSGTSYRVNPVDYVFAYPHQIVNESTQKEYGIKHYEPIKFVGDPVERNSKVDQLKVITKTLRARTEPNLNGEVLGYVKQGIYDVHGVTEADGYTWYQIDKFWCANNKAETWCNYLPKTEPHFDLTLHNLTESQKNTLVTYAKESGFEYSITEL